MLLALTSFVLFQAVYLVLLSFDSLSFTQSDFGMDVGGSSQALVTAAPVACAATAVAPKLSTRCTRVTRSRKDQRMITWMRQRIIDLEKLMKTKQAEVDKLNARPAPSTERELYLLSEIELIGRQFESEYLGACPSFRGLSLVESISYMSFSCLQRSIATGKPKTFEWNSALPKRRRGTPRVRSTSGLTCPKPRS